MVCTFDKAINDMEQSIPQHSTQHGMSPLLGIGELSLEISYLRLVSVAQRSHTCTAFKIATAAHFSLIRRVFLFSRRSHICSIIDRHHSDNAFPKSPLPPLPQSTHLVHASYKCLENTHRGIGNIRAQKLKPSNDRLLWGPVVQLLLSAHRQWIPSRMSTQRLI